MIAGEPDQTTNLHRNLLCQLSTQNTKKNHGFRVNRLPPTRFARPGESVGVVKASYAELLQVINVPFRELMDMLADIDRVPKPGNSGGSLLVGWNGRVGFGVFECLVFF